MLRLPHLQPWHGLTLLHVAAIAIGLLLYIALTHSGRQRRAPSSAMAWVIALVAFPYLALPIYLLFGTRKLAHARVATDAPGVQADTEATWSTALTRGLDLPPPRHCRGIALHTEGTQALKALLELLDSATARIDIEMFIFRDDAVGTRIAEALRRASQRGVAVRVLLDGLGAFAGHRRSARMLRDAGARLRWFSPLRLRLRPQFGRGNLRNHRKLVVVDARACWSGGRNFASEYFLDEADAAAWRDLSFVVEGRLVVDAVACFERDWASAGGDEPPRPIPAVDPDAHGPLAQLLPSGPDRRDDTAYDLFLSAIHRADRSVRIATPYFVPDTALLSALTLAARRGVRIELLLPARSNHRLSDLARRRALRSLHAAGGELWLAPQMLHAKLVVIDDEMALAGSANLDGRSLLINYELMMAFHDRDAIAAFTRWFDDERAPAAICTPKGAGLGSDLLEGLLLWVGFQL